jgi:hypothetical protein
VVSASLVSLLGPVAVMLGFSTMARITGWTSRSALNDQNACHMPPPA